MEECSVLIETTKLAEDKTSRWFDLPIDYELFRDLLGVEADSKDYQITDMKLPFAGDIVRTTSVRRLNKLYFTYTDLSPEVQQAYKELIPCCGTLDKTEILRISAINPLHRHNRESTLCMPAELLAINPCKQSIACLIV